MLQRMLKHIVLNESSGFVKKERDRQEAQEEVWKGEDQPVNVQ